MLPSRSATRADPRDIAELKLLAARQPELSAAASLQIELIQMQRRVQLRTATSGVSLSMDEMGARLANGRPLLDFDHVSIDWSEARLLIRQVVDTFRRHGALDDVSAARLYQIGRTADLPELARRWFEKSHTDSGVEMLEEVLVWALRPFLVHAADVLRCSNGRQRDGNGARCESAFDAWRRGDCPVCGGEPDFARITNDGDHELLCGRCQTEWRTDPSVCPFCGENEKGRITTFATSDRTYRVIACKSCRRYLKVFDGRRTTRAAMPTVDAIATLPLDAVVIQCGFTNG